METYRTGQVASATGVSTATVRRWIKEGDIEAFQFPPGKGEFRIRGVEIARVCRNLGRTVPEWVDRGEEGEEESSSFSDASRGLLVYGR